MSSSILCRSYRLWSSRCCIPPIWLLWVSKLWLKAFLSMYATSLSSQKTHTPPLDPCPQRSHLSQQHCHSKNKPKWFDNTTAKTLYIQHTQNNLMSNSIRRGHKSTPTGQRGVLLPPWLVRSLRGLWGFYPLGLGLTPLSLIELGKPNNAPFDQEVKGSYPFRQPALHLSGISKAG